jgi:hypothetical protein
VPDLGARLLLVFVLIFVLVLFAIMAVAAASTTETGHITEAAWIAGKYPLPKWPTVLVAAPCSPSRVGCGDVIFA